ncbi:MAG TPA: transglycosylase domain-containing protein, partial [Candidatus Saccharimonadales bacterium]|nr:transglycosylase domain-containing protein [Candidatus Saccharimonadales bacterium]
MSENWQPPKPRFMPSRFRSLFTRKRVLIAGSILGAFLILTPAATYAYYARDINDRERLMNHNSTGVVLKDRNGEVFYESGRVNDGDNVTLDQISDNLEQALVASEDKNFYEHEGYSLRGIAGALYANVLNKDAKAYGGSTITQQLVKNNLLSAEKSYLRKYQEVSMAVAVERQYTKQEILEMYLNSVYFGEGAFGIADAAKTYFGKSPADLTVAESAMLVGLLPAPNTYSPINGDPQLAAKQQERVLRLMAEQGYITAEQREQAGGAELTYASGGGDSFTHAQHYALMVLDELNKTYGEERVRRAGFEVTTGLDLAQQKEAEEIVQRRVATFAAGGGRNASLVAIDPKTGQVRALVGSVNWNNEQFGKVNMAVTPRQPGSSFKPIYFAEALDRKLITAATILKDERRTFGDWTPNNFDFKFKGNMTVRSALAESRNITAAEVMEKLGPEEAAAAARRMGISTVTEPEKYGLTLSLGTAETKLYEMTNAYAGLANGGLQHDPTLITAVQDKYGNRIFEHTADDGDRILSREAAFVLSSILSDNSARAPTFGSSLNIPGGDRSIAVKTGTTDESKDAWTIGYTTGLAVGVWVGNNESQPMRGLAGGSSAGVIWREAMTVMLEDAPPEKFTPPAGVTQVTVCRGTSEPRRATRSGGNTYSEYFISGTAPTRTCNAGPTAEDLRKQEKQRRDAEERMREETKRLREEAED